MVSLEVDAGKAVESAPGFSIAMTAGVQARASAIHSKMDLGTFMVGVGH